MNPNLWARINSLYTTVWLSDVVMATIQSCCFVFNMSFMYFTHDCCPTVAPYENFYFFKTSFSVHSQPRLPLHDCFLSSAFFFSPQFYVLNVSSGCTVSIYGYFSELFEGGATQGRIGLELQIYPPQFYVIFFFKESVLSDLWQCDKQSLSSCLFPFHQMWDGSNLSLSTFPFYLMS